MKIFKRVLITVFLIILVVGTIVFLNGYKVYADAIKEISLGDKISKIQEDSSYVLIGDLPEYYKNAIIAVEDHRFYDHGAIDIIAIGRAIWTNIKNKEFQEGGSTITQQVAKNLYFISEEDVVSRKIAEVLVGFDLEEKYSKDDIVEFYMNTIYFGDGYYGIQEACKGYLGKDAKDMTLSEATMMAGIPNAPSVYAPTKNPDLTKKRQKKVISSMVKYNYLSQEEAEKIIP